MKYILAVVNLPNGNEWHLDHEFQSMEALLAYVGEHFVWSSLVITVLP